MQERNEAARLKLERARARAGQARRHALALPIGLFGILWVAVFAQMATGNDPALGSSAAGPVTRQVDRRTTGSSEEDSSASRPQRAATALAFDPITGTIVRVPASAAQRTTPTPAPTPAPVTTSQS